MKAQRMLINIIDEKYYKNAWILTGIFSFPEVEKWEKESAITRRILLI